MWFIGNDRSLDIGIIVVIGNSLYSCKCKLHLFLLIFKYQYAECSITQAIEPKQFSPHSSLLFSYKFNKNNSCAMT